MSHRVCIAVFNDRPRAEMMRGLLESEGISALIRSDDAGGYRPELAFTLGIRLEVDEEDRFRAREILHDYGADDMAEVRDEGK